MPPPRPATSDRQASSKATGKGKDVRVAMLTTTYDSQHPTAAETVCSCGGWRFFHVRTKVREDRAQAHLNKKHGGQGLWM